MKCVFLLAHPDECSCPCCTYICGGDGLVAKSCPILCDPMDCCPPGSSVYGMSQERILKWFAVSFSRGSSRLRDRTCISCLAGRYFTTEPPGKYTYFA